MRKIPHTFIYQTVFTFGGYWHLEAHYKTCWSGKANFLDLLCKEECQTLWQSLSTASNEALRQ